MDIFWCPCFKLTKTILLIKKLHCEWRIETKISGQKLLNLVVNCIFLRRFKDLSQKWPDDTVGAGEEHLGVVHHHLGRLHLDVVVGQESFVGLGVGGRHITRDIGIKLKDNGVKNRCPIYFLYIKFSFFRCYWQFYLFDWCILKCGKKGPKFWLRFEPNFGFCLN